MGGWTECQMLGKFLKMPDTASSNVNNEECERVRVCVGVIKGWKIGILLDTFLNECCDVP